MRSGKFSTLSSLEFHKAENDVSLLDILEDEVPQKFFLSEERKKSVRMDPGYEL